MTPELHDHYLTLIDRWQREADSNKAKLFDAWQALRGQQKGLNRQARKIRRLQAQIAALKANAQR